MARPTKIDVYQESFNIAWDDGHESIYPSRYLRSMCSCASCVAEWTGQRLVTEDMIPEDVEAVEVGQVGNYAIRIIWSDGHSTGIYPYDRLREICPCPECRGG